MTTLFHKFHRTCLLVSWLMAEYISLSAVFCTTTPHLNHLYDEWKGKRWEISHGTVPKCNFLGFFPQCFIMNSFKHYPYAYHLSSAVNILPYSYLSILCLFIYIYVILWTMWSCKHHWTSHHLLESLFLWNYNIVI